MTHTTKKIISILALATVLILVFCYYAIMHTTSGLRLFTKLAQPILKAQHIQIHPQDIHGTLSHIRLDALTTEIAPIQLTANNITLDWQPWALLKGDIDITALQATQVTLAYKTHTEQNSNPNTGNAFSLPSLQIKHLNIDHIDWQVSNKKTYALGHLTAALSSSQKKLTLKPFQLISKQHQLHLKGHLLLSKNWQIYLKGNWQQSLANDRTLHIPLLINGSASYYQGQIGLNIKQNQQTQLAVSTQFTGNRNHLSTRYWHSFLLNGPSNPLQGNLSLNWHHPFTWQLQLISKKLNLSLFDPRLNRDFQIAINSQKNAQTSQSHLSLKYSQYAATIDTVGQASTLGWQTNIQSIHIRSPLGNWQNQSQGQINIGAHTVNWQALCLHHLQAKICSNGQWKPQNWHITLNSNTIDLAHFSAPIYGTKQIGQLQFSLALQQKPSSPITGQLSTILTHFSLNPIQHNPLFTYQHALTIPSADWKIILNPKTIQSHFQAQFNQEGAINGQITLGRQTPYPLSATARMHIQNIGIFNNLLPSLYQLKGQLAGQFQLSGTVHNPHYTGKLAIQKASAILPLYGVSLKDTDLHINSDQQGQLQLSANSTSGKGQLKLQGNLSWQDASPRLHINIHGKDFTLLNTPAVKLAISPTLTFTRTHKQQSLQGQILIPSAEINANLLHRRLNNSDDIVWVDANGQPLPKKPMLPFYSDLTLTLGKHIQIQGFGIFAHLIGHLSIKSQPHADTTGTGTLQLTQARYQNYGKTFNITKGLILFDQRPLDNPSLDVIAHYQLTPGSLQDSIEPIDIGVRVLGTLKKPQVNLFSHPSMSQANILSYIVVGVPLNRVQGDEKNILSRAAISYSLNGGEDHSMLGTIQDKLGIDQISVGSIDNTSSMPANANNPNSNITNDQSGQDNTAIFIGKAISPRLYVSYGIGLFNQQQEIRTRYQLSRQFQLLTDHSSEYSGADLVFTINK